MSSFAGVGYPTSDTPTLPKTQKRVTIYADFMSTVESDTQDKAFWDQHGRVGLVWSNPDASDDVLITAALLRPNFHLLLDIAVHFGLDRLKNQWRELKASAEERQYPEEIRKVERAEAIVARCLTTMEEATCAN
jgi:hypothetical protein